ncbi:MAG TPA: FlgD immunoglobulin-like domain containing protein [Solirubrobacter sp.]|nr:FlgD immunoglobulin-like domain containing protein [Solirubrobacter sp.]
MTLVARVAFLVLVGATFAAFFVAQRLKNAPPVIDVSHLTSFFSPNGDGRRDVNPISITLRVTDHATVDVVDARGDRVRRLTEGVPVRAHEPLRLDWDGRDDDGTRVADGRYGLRVALRAEGRSAIVAKQISLDTSAPRSLVCVGTPCDEKTPGNVVAAGSGSVRVYVDEPSRRYRTTFRVLRTDDGPPHEVAQFKRRAGFHRGIWDGRVDGKPAPPGTYLVQAQVRDRAGNVGRSPAVLEPGAIAGRPGLTIRGIAAQPPLRPVTEGRRVEFFVDARGRGYRWRVRRIGERRIRAHGKATAPHLAFRAPKGPSGAYLLELRSGRWRTSVPFLVQAAQRSKLLVVVPAITWLGRDKVDDPPFDGLPNTLEDGASVRWPRTFRGTGGLPAGFADDVAPLLVYLDRRRIRYDLTSDIDLDLTRNPRASDRAGVLLAGSERWVTRPLAKRLRRYVLDGGRLALFGADSLRRGVRLRVLEAEDAGTLVRPTQPTPTDPFGARIARERTTPAPVAISQFAGDGSYGLMEGVLELPGFTSLEETASFGDAKVLAGVGQPLSPQEEADAAQSGKPPRELRPALTAARLGKGTVIRVGLPEWTDKLGERGVAQVTHNIVDILRGVKPRIRSEGDRDRRARRHRAKGKKR